MAKSIDLYYLPPHFYSQKIRMYLEEKGADYSLHRVNILKGEDVSDDYLTMNPSGKVPMLKADGIVLSDLDEIFKFGEESIAGDNLSPSEIAPKVWRLHDELQALKIIILTYGVPSLPSFAANVHPMFKKCGSSCSNTLKILESRLASAKKEFVPRISEKIDQRKAVMKATKSEEEVSAELERVNLVLDKCAGQLAENGGPFLFGGTLTIADIDLAVLLLRLRMLGLEDRMWAKVDSRKSLVAYMEKLERRSSFQVIVKDSTDTGTDWAHLAPFFIVGGISVAVASVALGLLVANRKIFQ